MRGCKKAWTISPEGASCPLTQQRLKCANYMVGNSTVKIVYTNMARQDLREIHRADHVRRR